ncbi:hypothetical protein RJ639_038352 [Escallonia herrerae]|uniref:AP2/ERF domain-containing protein n=1 Tax=Escallonia herrerae TaxID=1293975 RepID=A0AA88WPG4_9ASTE|nr:hypothetical protein RJ639_038352 [Escallonia herrerae]
MKSMDGNNNGSGNSNSSSWLGFSLSPHMKMEVNSSDPQHHSTTTSAAAPTSFYLSTSHFYGVGAENGGFHSPLSVMPLKSDGSLCIMEALSRSQSEGMVPNSSPKLEDFLGGAAHHQYGGHDEREAMALSLDSMYYHHQGTIHEPETESRQHSLDLLQEPFGQQHQDNIQEQTSWYHGMYQPSAEEGAMVAAGHYPDHHQHHALVPHQQLNSSSMVDEGGTTSGTMGTCGDLQSLTLSMSPGSQSSCVTASRQISPTGAECFAIETKKRGSGKVAQKPVHRKSLDTFGQRTSQYRGVTSTTLLTSHASDIDGLVDMKPTCGITVARRRGKPGKGGKVTNFISISGGYDMEEKAARSYDLAALKYWGHSTHINFPLENYQQELEVMKNMSRQEYVAHLRRKSSGFSRGASMYRGVTRHHQHGRWQARIGRVAGNKDLYLGTFSTQEEAAEAYDIAAIKFRGVNAVTNFDITRYDVERIMASNTLLAGELARRNKERVPTPGVIECNPPEQNSEERAQSENNSDWKMVLAHQSPQQQQQSTCIESLHERIMSANAHYRNSSFSVALQDLIGIESVNTGHLMGDESAKLEAHFSNPSSLVTSLSSSSREASPDKTGASMFLATKFINSPTGVNSWMASAHLRPAPISMSHLPVFAAWNET